MLLLNSSQSQQLDKISEQLGVSTEQLMQNAGKAVAAELAKRAKPGGVPIIVFAGKGNNGGDAKIAAKILEKQGYRVELIPFEGPLKKFATAVEKGSWIIDGLLGTGIKGGAKGWIAEAIEAINASGKPVLSIDIPSGLSADRGIPLGPVVKATVTVCLGGVKLGCFVHPGCDYAGEIVSADIGIPPAAYAQIATSFHSIEPEDFKEIFKKRPVGGHKGDFGHLLVVAGSLPMPGAGFLAAHAALHAGCGMVTYVLPESAYQKFESQFAEVMIQPVADAKKGFFTLQSLESVLKLCEKKRAVVLGPGLGRDPQTEAFVQELISKIDLPLVLDADGLFCISKSTALLKERKKPTILTPHSGEMATLLGWQNEEVLKAKVQVALEGAAMWRSILILKGYRSMVGLPDGRLYVNPTGNPGMATAGMGDVLAGILGGLLAQGFSPEKSALAGVYLHGLAGDMARDELGEKGLIASDVSRYVPRAAKRCLAPFWTTDNGQRTTDRGL